MFDTTDLAVKASIFEMVGIYKKAIEDLEAGYDLVAGASKSLHATFERKAYRADFSCLPSGVDVPAIKLRLRASAWSVIIDMVGVKKIMSLKEIKEIERKIEEKVNLPEIEVATVFDAIQAMVQNCKDYAEEMYLEVFDTLTPGKCSSNEYKTNAKEARRRVGKKVILSSNYVDIYPVSGCFRVFYQRENILVEIDKAFHLLDGKGVPGGYKSPLVDAINTVGRDGKGETEYFKFVCYMNGNLHITFKRPDLVAKLNLVAGNKYALTD